VYFLSLDNGSVGPKHVVNISTFVRLSCIIFSGRGGL
jgi:hypothetical protein